MLRRSAAEEDHVEASPATTPRRKRRPPGQRPRDILGAAERLFAERGYARTSMREIAAAVGITDAALYRHFPSKRAILESVYEARGFFRAIEELEHLPGARGMEAQFAANAVAAADVWARNADFLRVTFMEALAGDERALDVHVELMERWRRGIERLFLIYAARGEVAADDAPGLAETLVTLEFGAFMDRLLMLRSGEGEQQFQDPAFRSRLVDQVRRLVRSQRSAA
ncbi:MAG: TetR/AcrR family transcriptional regulator [Dehalococcoidia bacterium]|nr:TetR/AcrR family transcriptional regulator [Dehalococcoidia bacterium]